VTVKINADRLAQIICIGEGKHHDISEGICIMEAVAYVAGEPWSDHPECACPIISTFLRSWNDALPDDKRTTLLLPLIPQLIGTRGSKTLEMRRAMMLADWLIRICTPAWLRLAKLDKQADALTSLPEITDFGQVASIRPTIEAVRDSADAAGDAAWAAAKAAAKAAAWAADWVATGDAGATAKAAAWAAAWAAAKAAAWVAIGDAAWLAAKDALKATEVELQQSALILVDRMIREREAA
jgi:hypothetical protein